MSQSHWRRISREVIEATLAALPADAPLKEKRKAVSAAYPFGERAMHPYKMWCKEVQAALGKSREKKSTGVVRICPFAKAVRCSWCDNKGCLSCLNARQLLERESSSINWQAWQDWEHRLEAFPQDRGLIQAQYADWLEENGFGVVAGAVRRGERW